jgi:thiol:disulfide interchange protein DsbD
MSFVPGIPNPYLAAFAGGLFYGLAFCTSACLPYIASYIAGIGAGFRKGVMVTLTYNSGRIAAYALIGGVIGLISGSIQFFAGSTAMISFQKYSSFAFGIVTIILGAIILFKSKNLSCNQTHKEYLNPKLDKLNQRFDFGAFSLGLSRGLVICPALLALLVYAAPFAAPIDSLVLAVLFGLGTTLSPLLLLGGATGWLLNKAPLLRTWISRLGAIILILLGVAALWTAITTPILFPL